jgi:hypothetical protein
MPESEDGVFLDLNIKDKVNADPVPVGVVLQAMAEYQMIPMPTPAMHRILIAFQNKILNPVWLKEQEAKMQEQQTMAENMQQGMFSTMAQQWGIAPPPSANDLNPDDPE